MPMDPAPKGPGAGPPFGGWLWKSLLRGTQAGIAILDTELRFRYVNPAMAQINGLPGEEHTGRTLAEVVPRVELSEEMLLAVLADGVPREIISSGQTRADSPHSRRYWQGSYHRLTDPDGQVVGIGAVVLEVSADREIQRELERARERLLLLDAAAVRIGSTLEMERTCQELADLLVEVLADAAGVDVLASGRGEGPGAPPPGTLRLRRAALAGRPELWAHAGAFGKPGDFIDYEAGSSVPRCLETGLPVVLNFVPDEEISRAAPNAERVEAYRAADIHSGLIVPLSARGEAVGTVTLVRAGASAAFDDEDVAVAGVLADRAAISLDNARR
jgi:PAS domain S-box-containing protein